MLKKLLIILLIVVVAGGGYYFFVVQKPSGSSTLVKTSNGLTSQANPAGSVDASQIGDIGQEFLSSLLSLKKMTLNDGVFNDPAFKSLQDFTRPLVQLGNEGRANPFAPIGVDPISMTTTPSSQQNTPSQGGTNSNTLLNQLLNN